MQRTQTFSVLFSLVKFLMDTAHEAAPDVPVFVGETLSSGDETLLSQAARFWHLLPSTGEISVFQPIDVTCHLGVRQTTDPSLQWLNTTPLRFNTLLMTRRDPARRLIPVYDIDALVDDAAMQTYYATGQLPEAVFDALTLPNLPDYVSGGQTIGLQVLTTTTPKSNTTGLPYMATWRVSFRYYEPAHALR